MAAQEHLVAAERLSPGVKIIALYAFGGNSRTWSNMTALACAC